MDAETQLIIYEAETGFERLKNAYMEQADELEVVTLERDNALRKIEELEQQYDTSAERYGTEL